MPARFKLTDEQISAIKKARAAGKSIPKIALELGVSEAAVKKYGKGVERPEYEPITPEIVKTARSEYAKDRTVTVLQLADQYGGVDPLKLAKALKGEMFAGIRNPLPLAALRPEPDLEALRRERT